MLTAALSAVAEAAFWAGDSSKWGSNPAADMVRMEDGEINEVEAVPQAAAAESEQAMNNLSAVAKTREDGVGRTLADAKNGFNKLSYMAMLWTVQHSWSKGIWFPFNCYQHKTMLFISSSRKLVTILWSQEGMTKGDLLVMILYGFALLPLAEKLGTAFQKS